MSATAALREIHGVPDYEPRPAAHCHTHPRNDGGGAGEGSSGAAGDRRGRQRAGPRAVRGRGGAPLRTWQGPPGEQPPTPGVRTRERPQVPTAVVQTRPAATEPGTIFTWKVERDEPPVFIMRVASTWTRQVAHQGYALLDGHPVVDVGDWDDQGRPLTVRAVILCGTFDPTIHGGGRGRTMSTVEWDGTTPARRNSSLCDELGPRVRPPMPCPCPPPPPARSDDHPVSVPVVRGVVASSSSKNPSSADHR